MLNEITFNQEDDAELEKKSPTGECKELQFPEMEPDMLSEDQELIFSIPVVALEEMEPEKQPECCIYKVPQRLRGVKEEAYTPKLVSIGPYYYGQPNLKKMEDLKVRYFIEAINRTKKNLDDFTRCIRKIKYKKILHCEVIAIVIDSFSGLSYRVFLDLKIWSGSLSWSLVFWAVGG
nr:upf0481 protein [Quercus suber]